MFSTPKKNKLESPFLAQIQAEDSFSFPSPGILVDKKKQTSTPFYKRSQKEVTFHIPDISVISHETPQRKRAAKENTLPVPRVKSPSKDIFSGMESDAFHSCVEDFSDDHSEIKDSKGRIFHEITNENENSFAKDLNNNLSKYVTPNAQKTSKIINEEKSFYKTPSDGNPVKKENTFFMTPLENIEASQARSATKYYTPSYVPHSPAPRSGKLEDITNRLSNLLDNIRPTNQMMLESRIDELENENLGIKRKLLAITEELSSLGAYNSQTDFLENLQTRVDRHIAKVHEIIDE